MTAGKVWPEEALANLCRIVIGRTPSRDNPSYWDGDHPWLSISDMNGARQVSEPRECITGLAVTECRCRLVPAGTVLLSFKLSIGKVAIAGRPLYTNEAIAALPIYDETKLDRDYLYWALRSLNLAKGSDRAAKGLTLNKAKLEEIQVPIPPLNEQRRIATILDTGDAVRRKRQLALALADQFLRSAFLEMFGDPVLNPKGWASSRLDSLADVLIGNPFQSARYVDDGVRLCRGANVLPTGLDWDDVRFWPLHDQSTYSKYELAEGDVILALDRPWISSGLKVAQVTRGDLPALLVQRVARIRAKNAAWNAFIYFMLRHKAFESHCCPTETTVPHISPVELRDFQIMVPSDEAIMEFGQLVERHSSLRGQAEASNDAAIELLASLSQRAFRGEL